MLSTPSLGITDDLQRLPSTNPNMLSTPSLGITRSKQALTTIMKWATFNSLSRDHFLRNRQEKTIKVIDFQLPLSGSLQNEMLPEVDMMPEAFNSLSRDHTHSWD